MKTVSHSRSAARTGAAMIAMTLLSKALGVLRTALIAARFGTGSDASAYAVAEKLPLSLFELLIGSAVAACFVPAYQQLRVGKGGTDGASDRLFAPCEPGSAAAQFAARFGAAVLLGAVPLTLLGVFLPSPLLSLAAPGLTGEGAQTAVRLLRILFWAVLPAAGTAIYSGLLQSHGHFILPAGVSVLSNAAVIGYLILTRGRNAGSIYGLAAVNLAAWGIQLFTLAVPAHRYGLSLFGGCSVRTGHGRRSISYAAAAAGREGTAEATAARVALRTAMRTAPAVLLSSWLVPGGALCGLCFASLTADGVTVFNYAHGIFLIAAGILTYSICNYLFPTLSAQAVRDRSAMEDTVRRGLIWLTTLTLPAAVLLTLLARPTVAVLYQRSAFTAQDTEAVSACLRAMAWALPLFAANELGARIAYAQGKPRRTASAALAGLALQCAVGILLSRLLPGSVCGAGFGCAFGIAVSACVLLVRTARDLHGVFDKQLALPLLCTAAGALIAGGAAWGVLTLLGTCIPDGGTRFSLIAVLCAGGTGAAACFGWLLAVRHLLPAADALPGIGRRGGNV